MIELFSPIIRNFKLNSFYKQINIDEIHGNYIHSFKNEIDRNISAISSKVRYVIFDTETTGMDPKKDKLLSIGAIGIHGNSIVVEDSFYKLIQINRESGKDIIVHGILPSESRIGENLEDVLLEFLNFINNSIIIAHHIDFDLDFLNHALNKLWNLEILNRKVDTAKLAERIEEKSNSDFFVQDRSRYQLDILCKKYDILQFARHHALTDSLTTAILFLKLQSKWTKMGWDKLRDQLVS